jgi:hypothetical protein
VEARQATAGVDPSHARTASRGILVTAYGTRRYRDFAVTLAKSLDLYSPDIPRAVVTDGEDPRLARFYQHLIPFRPERGPGFFQKLWLLEYSPFERTLYLDSDALVVRDLDPLWEMFQGHAFAAVGERYRSEGYWCGDIAERCRRFGVPSVPTFNGGLFYFEKGPAAQGFFSDARAIAERYDEHGFDRVVNDSISDEAIFSLLIARGGEGAMVDDDARSMRTPLGGDGRMRIDVLRGIGRFVKNDRVVEPAVVHFCGPHASGFYYRRERAKLELHARGLPTGPVVAGTNGVFGVARVLKRLSGRVRRILRRATGTARER